MILEVVVSGAVELYSILLRRCVCFILIAVTALTPEFLI